MAISFEWQDKQDNIDEVRAGDINYIANKSKEVIEGFNGAEQNIKKIQNSVSDIEKTSSKLIRKITVAEDVTEITISTDEEGKPFSLNDFEIRFCGKHSTTMWLSIGKGEKYFSANQVANNIGLPFYFVTNGFIQNVVAHYRYSGSNYFGVKFRQSIGAYDETTGKYATGAGEIVPFSTSPVNSNVSTINITAISGGVINAGSVIEIWGY